MSFDVLRRLWARMWLRGSHFSSRYGNLQRLYIVRDPWNLASPREQARFARTNEVIASAVPECRTLLEIGCGEGLQTEHLLEVSDAVTGLEVSAQAIKRAREKLPKVEFKVGAAEDVPQLFAGRRFDLVTACEVLYYMTDVPGTLAHLQSVTDALLVTSYSGKAAELEKAMAGAGWQELAPISAEDTVWRVFLWRAAA